MSDIDFNVIAEEHSSHILKGLLSDGSDIMNEDYSIELIHRHYPHFMRLVMKHRVNLYTVRNMYKLLNEEITLSLHKHIRNVDLSLSDDSISEGEFLLALAVSKRDYRKDCCICLTRDIMGTTCTCGHTEIAVFRPCGHSICAKPCFYNLCENMNKSLSPTVVTYGKQKFTIPNKMDISIIKDFECPLCRKNVDSVFRAEDAYLNPDEIVSIDYLANIAKCAIYPS